VIGNERQAKKQRQEGNRNEPNALFTAAVVGIPVITIVVSLPLLGGSEGDRAGDVSVRRTTEVTFLGSSSSTNYPTTAGAFDTTFNGGGDLIKSRITF
jgi:hypothetical protein